MIDHGFAGASIIHAFRLLDARQLREALAHSPVVLALVVSAWFFDEVVRHSVVANPSAYRPVRVAVKETVTTAWICLPEAPFATPNSAVDPTSLAPRQLPAAIGHFAGRTAELESLNSLLDEAHGTVIISAIDGTAGIGKTALAVYW